MIILPTRKDSVRIVGVDILPLKLWEDVRKKFKNKEWKMKVNGKNSECGNHWKSPACGSVVERRSHAQRGHWVVSSISSRRRAGGSHLMFLSPSPSLSKKIHKNIFKINKSQEELGSSNLGVYEGSIHLSKTQRKGQYKQHSSVTLYSPTLLVI